MPDFLTQSKTRIAQTLAKITRDAATSVAPYLRESWRTNFIVENKNGIHDPVTIHDRETEKRLITVLREAVPGCAILGEESEAAGVKLTSNGSGSRVRFIIDPIDGTACFSAGMHYFGTSIAAELDGLVVAGTICAPTTGEVFSADLETAWLSYLDDNTQTILRACGPKSEAQSVAACYYPTAYDWARYPTQCATERAALAQNYATLRTPGAAALDLAYVAAGWLGVAMGTGMKPWDVAAGMHILKMAGGKVFTFDRGLEENPQTAGMYVATGQHLTPKIACKIISQVADRRKELRATKNPQGR